MPLHFTKSYTVCKRRYVPVGVPLDLSTPTRISCIGTYGENCKSDNVSKYRFLLVAFQLLLHEILMSRKKTVLKFIMIYQFRFLFSENTLEYVGTRFPGNSCQISLKSRQEHLRYRGFESNIPENENHKFTIFQTNQNDEKKYTNSILLM